MNNKPKQYEIKTFRDIFTKIPEESLERFVEEFPAMILAGAQAIKMLGGEVPVWVDGLTWIDDGEKNIDFVLKGFTVLDEFGNEVKNEN